MDVAAAGQAAAQISAAQRAQAASISALRVLNAAIAASETPLISNIDSLPGAIS